MRGSQPLLAFLSICGQKPCSFLLVCTDLQWVHLALRIHQQPNDRHNDSDLLRPVRRHIIAELSIHPWTAPMRTWDVRGLLHSRVACSYISDERSADSMRLMRLRPYKRSHSTQLGWWTLPTSSPIHTHPIITRSGWIQSIFTVTHVYLLISASVFTVFTGDQGRSNDPRLWGTFFGVEVCFPDSAAA